MHCSPARVLLPIALLALAIPACRNSDRTDDWLGTVTEVANPAGSGSRYPHLATTADGAVLSWLQPTAAGGFALQHASWRAGAWSPVGTIASGDGWFVNWADFPSVVPLSPRIWAGHWLEQRPGNVYSYDVRIAVSDDAGATWSAPFSPHDDGTPTEHGFVSLFAGDGQAMSAWLDGRRTAGGHDHAAGGSGAMTLRSAALEADGVPAGGGLEVDARVCDCCQTDAVATDDGPVLVYRDRSPDEVRDIALERLQAGEWSQPVYVNADGWKVDACPVNGPAVDAHGQTVVVAWFTAPDLPRVRLAFSADAGRSFGPPIEVARGDVIGRVDVVLLDDGRAVVSWLQAGTAGAELRAQPYSRTGTPGPGVLVAAASVQRSSGFPQMVRAGDGLLFAWTDSAASQQVRTAFARLR
jgi:hypothetical protein